MFQGRRVDIAVALVAPEGGVREAQGDGVLGRIVVFDHVALHISGAFYLLAREADPVFAFVLALVALEF